MKMMRSGKTNTGKFRFVSSVSLFCHFLWSPLVLSFCSPLPCSQKINENNSWTVSSFQRQLWQEVCARIQNNGQLKRRKLWVLATTVIYSDVKFSFQKSTFSFCSSYSCFQFKWNGHLLKIDTIECNSGFKNMENELMKLNFLSVLSQSLCLAQKCLLLALPELGIVWHWMIWWYYRWIYT